MCTIVHVAYLKEASDRFPKGMSNNYYLNVSKENVKAETGRAS